MMYVKIRIYSNKLIMYAYCYGIGTYCLQNVFEVIELKF